MAPKSGGDILREYREQRGLSQNELGAAVGKSDGAVSQWELGSVTPRRGTAMRIDELLGANGAVLRGFGYAPVTPPDPGPSEPSNSELKALLERLIEQVDNMGAVLETIATQALAPSTTDARSSARGDRVPAKSNRSRARQP